jgi:hypothetical protein
MWQRMHDLNTHADKKRLADISAIHSENLIEMIYIYRRNLKLTTAEVPAQSLKDLMN